MFEGFKLTWGNPRFYKSKHCPWLDRLMFNCLPRWQWNCMLTRSHTCSLRHINSLTRTAPQYALFITSTIIIVYRPGDTQARKSETPTHLTRPQSESLWLEKEGEARPQAEQEDDKLCGWSYWNYYNCGIWHLITDHISEPVLMMIMYQVGCVASLDFI